MLFTHFYSSRCGSDAEKLFPYATFAEQLKQFGRFGLVMATMVVPLFTSVQEDLPDLDVVCEQIERDRGMGNKMFKFEKTQDMFAVKMRDIIIDMDRLGYIWNMSIDWSE